MPSLLLDDDQSQGGLLAPALRIAQPDSLLGIEDTGGGPSLAEAWQFNADELARQQQISQDRGLWGDQGMTHLGALDAARQAAMSLIAGTAAPGEVAPGVGSRISTRVPTAKGQTIDPHATPDLTVGLDSSRASGDAFSKNIDLIRGYPDIPTGRLRSDDSVAERFIGQVGDNLKWLHDGMDPAIRERAMQWYDGANTIANRWADQ